MAALGLSRAVAASKFFKIAIPSCRQISTSQKKKEASEAKVSTENVYKKIPDFSKPSENKNWVYYGYKEDNVEDDTYLMHLVVFCMFGIVMGGWTFSYVYYPDRNRRDWAYREAYIRLHEREQLGLDPIDPNYVDPATVILPPDSELDEDEIII